MLFGNRGARSSGTEAAQERGVSAARRGTGTKGPPGTAPVGCRHTDESRRSDDHCPEWTSDPRWAASVHRRFVWTQSQIQGNQTTDPGLGILETGNVASQGVGFSVAALGDMNLDGSNDYLIGAPTVTQTGSVISPGTGTTSQAFLIFGNRSATLPTIQSWLSATPEQRVGVLANLGTSQPRPTHSPIAASLTITTLTGSPSSPASPPVHNSVPSSPPPAPTPSSSVLPTTPAAAVSTTSWPPRTSTALLEIRSDQPRHPHGLPGVDHRHLRGHRADRHERPGLVVR